MHSVASDSSSPLTASIKEAENARAAHEKVVSTHRKQESKDDSCQGQMNGWMGQCVDEWIEVRSHICAACETLALSPFWRL